MLDSFVGRQQELTRIGSLLRSERLVTLVGPGGVGKSRLALEFAGRAGDTTTLFVDLSSITQGALVGHIIAAAMGVGERSREPVVQTLASAIGDQRLLLLLDTCEHLVGSAADTVRPLLLSCPALRVLATSRQALGVDREGVLRIGELSLPSSQDEHSRERLLRSDAARLFIERARAAHPEFRLAAADIHLVAGICRRLDGLPLSIELAARRMGTLPLPDILAGIDGQLGLLSSGDRTAPQRHRELRATIGWSYRLLSPLEQAVFRRVSVLAGEFTQDQADSVCSGGGVAASAVPHLLSLLAAKSLLVRGPPGEHPPRYRQLHTVRAYAHACLAESGELDGTRRLALARLVNLAEHVTSHLSLTRESDGRLRAEGENLIEAVRDTSTGTADQRVLLAVALARYWTQYDQTSLGRNLLTEVLREVPESPYRGAALSQAALMAWVHNDQAEAMRLAEAAVKCERAAGNPARLAIALERASRALGMRQDWDASLEALRECGELLRRLGRTLELAMCQQVQAWQALSAGRPGEAAGLPDSFLPVVRAQGTPRQQNAALHTAGTLCLARGEADAARALFTEGLAQVPVDSYGGGHMLGGLAMAAHQRGEHYRAVCLAAAASAVWRRMDCRPEPGWQQWVEDAAGRAESRLGPARSAEARAAGGRLRDERLLAYALSGLAEDTVDHDRGSPLTEREQRIAALVAEGLSNRDIARQMSLSARTVAACLDGIRDKLDMRSRTEIAVWAATQRGVPGT